AAPGGAQTSGEFYVVKQSGTEVRALSDDSDENYVTNRLNKGDVVEVVEHLPGGTWLKIRPPKGSTSWISSTFLNPDIPPNQPNQVVYFKDAPPGDGAPVFPAPAPTEPTANKRPGVIGARLKGGHQVRRATKVIKDNGATWIEIESPATQEVRFIRADAVE